MQACLLKSRVSGLKALSRGLTLCGVFTLPDTETDKILVVLNSMEVFILHRDRHQHRFPLSWFYANLSVSISVSDSVNAPLHN